jgi:hypothetical protein
MSDENTDHNKEDARADLSVLDDAELAERILKNVYFAKNAFYFLSDSVDEINKGHETAPAWLLDEAYKKMREVNQCLNEMLHRINNLKMDE